MGKIRIDLEKCTGCRLCEIVCSLHHLETMINPKRARIKVFKVGQQYHPVSAGPFTDAECTAKLVRVMPDGTEYDDCALCRASCPAKPFFKEPDTETPLKCDFCGDPPDPQCVKVCLQEALSLVEK